MSFAKSFERAVTSDQLLVSTSPLLLSADDEPEPSGPFGGPRIAANASSTRLYHIIWRHTTPHRGRIHMGRREEFRDRFLEFGTSRNPCQALAWHGRARPKQEGLHRGGGRARRRPGGTKREAIRSEANDRFPLKRQQRDGERRTRTRHGIRGLWQSHLLSVRMQPVQLPGLPLLQHRHLHMGQLVAPVRSHARRVRRLETSMVRKYPVESLSYPAAHYIQL